MKQERFLHSSLGYAGSSVGMTDAQDPLPAVAGEEAGDPLLAVAEGNGFNHMGPGGCRSAEGPGAGSRSDGISRTWALRRFPAANRGVRSSSFSFRD